MMQFLTLEDETDLIEALIPPAAYPRLVSRVTTPGPYLVEGTKINDGDNLYLQITKLSPFHERE